MNLFYLVNFGNIIHRGFIYLIIPIVLLLSACLPSQPENSQNQIVVNPTENTVLLIEPTPTPKRDYGDNYEAIQLAWFYKPPASGDLNAVAINYSFFILHRKNEPERNALREFGIQTPILQYLLFSEIQNIGSCTKSPYLNQVANRPGDFCNLSQQHPDWFLLNNINMGYNNVMDPGNKEWQSFWLERAREGLEQYGWQGIFLDNVEASLEKRDRLGEIPSKYPDDASYQAAIEDNLRFLYTTYFKPKGYPLFANIISLEDPAVWLRYMQYLDGAMLEDFAVGWHEDYKSVSTWEMQMDLVEKTQALGKSVILVSQGNEFDHDRQVFALASYLLVNNGKATFRYTNADTYNQSWLYDNYRLQLGMPLGHRYKVGDTWERDFENGIILVNPNLKTASIKMR